MFVTLLILCANVLLSSVGAQSTGTSSDSMFGYSKVTTTQCDADDLCKCKVEAPPACSLDTEYIELVKTQNQLDLVYKHLSGDVIDGIESNLQVLLARMSGLEQRLHNQSISLTMTELSTLQDQVNQIRATLNVLEDTRNTTVTRQLQAEVDLIHESLLALSSKNPAAVKAEYDKEIEAIAKRLERCETNVAKHGVSDNGLDFLGDALPFNEPITTDLCPSTLNITVGEPVTHKFRPGVHGQWFKDPKPRSEEEKTRVYEIPSNAAINQRVSWWNNLTGYESTISHTKISGTSPCAFHNYGNKQLMLGGYLYYRMGYRASIVYRLDVFDSSCQSIRVNFDIAAGSSYLGNGHVTIADLNYDETGLYMVYSNPQGKIVIAKLNPSNMEVEKRWQTEKQKGAVANVFFVCGRMYTTDTPSARHINNKQWGFDTNTGEEFYIDLDVESKYGAVKELSYNPREKVIFGWDNQHAVVYPVYF